MALNVSDYITTSISFLSFVGHLPKFMMTENKLANSAYWAKNYNINVLNSWSKIEILMIKMTEVSFEMAKKLRPKSDINQNFWAKSQTQIKSK